jgi:ABC-2 type transport system ATP-binding protein
MLDLEHLERRYDGRGGVTDVSVHVPAGAIYVLCGANGAGKTTTLSVISGLLFARKGTLRVAGRDGEPRALPLDRYAPRTGFGFVGDQPVLDGALTGWQWLAFAAAVKQCPVDTAAASQLATELALDDATPHYPIHSLSFGNQRKIALWAELATTSHLLVLDEPLIGLDPIAIEAFNESARRFVSSGRSILLSTHLLAEAEGLATHVGFIHDGRTVREAAMEEIHAEGRLRDAFLRAPR